MKSGSYANWDWFAAFIAIVLSVFVAAYHWLASGLRRFTRSSSRTPRLRPDYNAPPLRRRNYRLMTPFMHGHFVRV